ncbi:doublecortin domain-containing protein 2-like isoform X1 [Acanthopagrus latus]|uniref:doublecortin domain-containing protein 2-like isoform X1 n=2 Tax=Acanthopagrus latus TaxID=8177 RepID=UPI00187CA942|nr:doublecortin domain-containing protein 2-like isoform X1 [Acanthopagrus latus]XP_036931196.1 doublecortin domain-containing protein 2-like isoform X1 [Acanthopagrus latus]XP_036931197.1 doublecortin domain-containing protein 2-like isoform X1 [Acanthopagrus latus]XP_036931198.1 doublecortin domain-containing protein 2-like isoform X1 [Acanthopagrus latus]XP_036931199.1 doublecortin domain-containing protein 2-like isoform X1 [Acanthopagrus latus]XP_036931201.1 doublecortin domain-containing
MSSEKPNFLSQPVVKSIFMFRNGDPYYEARRIVINQKRVSNFETLLREVTGGIQAPFGAVRNIYTPREGHKVDCMESLQSGEQYVAAGRERFKKMDYQHIGLRRRKMMQTHPAQARPLPQNRIVVSARFLKPIKEPCTIFVVANGDVLNPAMRLLIHQRMLSRFDRILEMITEKMGLRVLGGVRSLYTYEGHQVPDGNQLESGQLYVAVGREKFKRLPYSDLLFTKPRGMRRVNGMKAYSLPPIYRFSKQNGNGKSVVRSSDSRDSKASPPSHSSSNKEHLSSIVREISQARLISLRKKRSGQSMTLGISDNSNAADDLESKADDGTNEDKAPKDQPAEEKPADDDAKAAEESGEKAGEEEAAAANAAEEDASGGKEEEEEKINGEKEGGEEKKANEQTDGEKQGEAKAGSEEKEEVVEEKVMEEVTDGSEEEVKGEEQGSSSGNSDKTQDGKEKEDGRRTSSEDEKGERGKGDIKEGEKREKDSGKEEKSSEEQVNDVDTVEEQKESESSDDPGRTQADNETKESDRGRSGSGGDRNQEEEEEVNKTKEGATKESGEEVNGEVNGEVSGGDDGVESEAELDLAEQNSASRKDATENGETGEDADAGGRDKSRKEKD